MRLLCDVDGVIANWTAAVAKTVRSFGGEFDETKWFEQKKLPLQIRARVMAVLAHEGFCNTLEPLPGAIKALRDLMAAGCDVHFVTSLWNSPTWAYDRQRWLQRHGLLSSYNRLVFAKDKWVVKGDILIDDKVKNVLDWRAEWPNSIGIVWAQPWNAEYVGPNRFNDWQRVINLVTTLTEKVAA